MDENKIIRHLKQGDIASLEILVRAYQEKAIRTAYLITQDSALARDVVQATFIQIYKHIDQLDASRPFAPYFFKSVANAAVRASQNHQRNISFEQIHDETAYFDELVSVTDNPEDVLEAKEFTEKVAGMLAQLSPEQRAVIVMKYYLDYSESEMAHHLDTPKGTIKSRLHHARQQLKRPFQIDQPSPVIKEELA